LLFSTLIFSLLLDIKRSKMSVRTIEGPRSKYGEEEEKRRRNYGGRAVSS
jgi:hypothetical protein